MPHVAAKWCGVKVRCRFVLESAQDVQSYKEQSQNLARSDKEQYKFIAGKNSNKVSTRNYSASLQGTTIHLQYKNWQKESPQEITVDPLGLRQSKVESVVRPSTT